jgi:hypothetical protein
MAEATPAPAATDPAATPAAATDPTPAAAAPAAATDSASTTSAGPTSTTATDAAPPSTSTPSDAAAAAADAGPKSEPSLLEAASSKKPDAKTDSKADVKDTAKETPAPAEAKPERDKPKDDAKATDPAKDATAQAPPAPLKYEAFKLPDTIKLDDKELSKFTEIVGAKQLPQEDAQKLIDLYVEEHGRMQQAMAEHQRSVWNKLNDTWKTDTRKELGNHVETDLAMAKAVIEEYGGTPEQQREYMAHISNNGMGNFVGHIRLLRNIGRALNVFENSVVPANPSPPKPAKTPGNRGWYEKTGNGAAAS